MRRARSPAPTSASRCSIATTIICSSRCSIRSRRRRCRRATSPRRSAGFSARQANVEVLLADVRAIDTAATAASLIDGGDAVPYDYLVLAAGAAHAYFGHPEWADRAPGLKTLDDALEMRRRVLLAFEAAERETDPRAQRRLLTFVIVGARPDRRRARRRARRDRAAVAAQGLPPHPSRVGAHRAARGRPARARAVCRNRCAQAARAIARAARRRGAHGMRSSPASTRMASMVGGAERISARRCCGPPASPRRRSRSRSACRSIAPAA